ncbi:thiopeptide-type bacteriocin biosynthesis protein [Paenibacillus sp. HN-1]|uniref:thiopeptide-type bacteriocin biosynthesis protein n=1 Tax=Paenibacillus TaxID=44249 RepID=UPI001CA94135|nr:MULTISPECIES: thiopeptide-type bacteriocin biosynthesis protein [Paenibacillus]MBY9077977.1 thiopeptide-type bacteriocin biosynthesis protein [Paenibacillus sp. CGMCC 1.18879]MBY9083919.1 thiopeptide-type bacteriocin biosynthesis protein [Paenibacillus sinensis]
MHTWKSYRVYYQFQPGYDGLIRLLAEQLEAHVARGRISKWFFLRYWEDGPHIRVRYLADEELGEEELFNRVRDYIRRYPAIHRLSKEEYFSGHKFDGEPLELQNLDWYEEGEIIPKQYEPEYERYGGASLMPLTESLFMESSRLAADMLDLMAGGAFTRRLIVGMRLLEELAERTFTRIPRLGEVLSFYRKSADSWQRLYQIGDMELPSKLARWCAEHPDWRESTDRLLGSSGNYEERRNSLLDGFAAIAEAEDDAQRVRSILYSHLHMLNNRCGIGPEYEYALYRTLWSHKMNQEVGSDVTVP